MNELIFARLARLARLGFTMATLAVVAGAAAPESFALACLGIPVAGASPSCGGPPPPPPVNPPPAPAPAPPPAPAPIPPPAPVPPPPPVPAPGPAPAPAPAPADSDGDGVPNSSDNCPTVRNDQADHDGDRIGNLCDPTPFAGEIVPGAFSGGAGVDVIQSVPISPLAATRCKTQRFTQYYDQFGVSRLNFIRYSGGFRVCYVPGVRIVSWGSVWGDATYVLQPWEWRGNDAGYPRAVQTGTRTVEFHYRGSAAICVVGWVCGPTKRPGLIITFTDNNTMTVRPYVV